MTNDRINDLISKLNSFEPSADAIEARLYELLRDFRSLPQRYRVTPAMLSLLERFPEADFGSPGPLVHELEATPGYLALLPESLRRQPTRSTVWMVNRVLNTALPNDQRESWMAELQAVLDHPRASEEIRRDAEGFLSYQRQREEDY
jgi:hypothetical protein